jgi:hypothetical protein
MMAMGCDHREPAFGVDAHRGEKEMIESFRFVPLIVRVWQYRSCIVVVVVVYGTRRVLFTTKEAQHCRS